MKETKLYSKLRPHLSLWGECDRVENTLGSGMSDVFYNIDGRVGWIETKIAKGDLILFEKFQPNWMRKHYKAGFHNIFVVVLDKSESIRVYKAGMILKEKMFAKDDFVAVNMSQMPPPSLLMTPPYRQWASLRELLIS